jgi:hypothetical protein
MEVKIFKVEVKELLSTVIEINASTEEEALNIVEEMYKKEEIVLDSSNHVTTEIEIFKE